MNNPKNKGIMNGRYNRKGTVNGMSRYAFQNATTGLEIKECRKKLGLSQEEFADFVNVSKKTVERWEYSKSPVTGSIVTLINILREHPQVEVELQLPKKTMPLRLSYIFGEQLCTVIDVDEKNRKVQVMNYTSNIFKRAFGNVKSPTYEQYEEFLESRCFPRSRDKMKLTLRELGLPFYDPLMIIEKTKGRMAEDDFWIQLER